MHACTHTTHAHTDPYTHILSLFHTYTCAHPYTHIHTTYTYAHTDRYTHTHTQTLFKFLGAGKVA